MNNEFETVMRRMQRLLSPHSNFVSTMQKYISQTDSALCDLYLAILFEEREKVKHISHTIKGGATIMYLRLLTEYSESIENKAEDAPSYELNRLYYQLCEEWALIKEDINKYIS